MPEIDSRKRSSAGILAVGTLLIPTLLNQHVISIQANDLSKSALNDIKTAQQHCKVATGSLKEKDYAISIWFADRPEQRWAELVDDGATLLKKCDAIRRDRISPSVGKQLGTDPIALLDKIQNQLKSQRTRGNKNPGVITIWLQNAEPRLRGTRLDFNRVRSQLQQITNDRSTVVIFGPTGELQSDLELAVQGIPRVELCPIESFEPCIKQAFNKARHLP
ncbi:MAG: hypothetical protein LH702_11270 [Phormidesmis sp. CAN_BIN44]|nr:hypothetical protein [Phormidesmis sp. CAN_BIN44]